MSERDDLYLILCKLLSGNMDQETRAALAGFDWRHLVKLAQAEGVAPLLFCILTKENAPAAGFPAIPSSALKILTMAYYQSAANNLLLLTELDRILKALAQANVAVIPLKGALLARAIYSDVALRPMNDLDLWVLPQQVGAALQAIQTCGYSIQKIIYHAVLQSDRSGQNVTVELHWLFPALRDPAVLFKTFGSLASQEPLAQSNQSLRVAPVTFHLLYLAAHLMLQHAGEAARLIWYYDLDILIRQNLQTLDWDALRQLAAALGWTTPLYWALAGAQERLQTPLPSAWLASLAASVATLPTLESIRLNQRRWLQQAASVLSWAERWRMTFSFLFPAPEYLRWRFQFHPAWLWPLGYLQRWIEIVRGWRHTFE